MPDLTTVAVFLTAAIILAITPGPGVLYVLTRTIKGGQSEGIASTLGTAIGGLFHIIVATFGLSALLATSAVAFSILKYAGAAYLIYLGMRTLMSDDTIETVSGIEQAKQHAALRQGIITELLNPKTALFFLAFIPQFINPAGSVALQFILLGSIVVLLNSTVDLVVVLLAGPFGKYLTESAKLRQGQRLFSGFVLIALGSYVAVADNQ